MDTSPAIVIAAIIAVSGVALTGLITWRLGNRSVDEAKRSASAAEKSATAATTGASAADRSSLAAHDSATAAKTSADAATRNAAASERSSEASVRSAGAAVEAVGVNRETAGAVAERANADALAKRYQDAAAQLGHEKAAVRLAGVYAMARLADDWPKYRQECVDVLCAYLRMPWAEADAKEAEGFDPSERQVRRTVMQAIEQRLRSSYSTPWLDTRLDLTAAKLVDFTLTDCDIPFDLVLFQAVLIGESTLTKLKLGPQAQLNHVEVHNQVRIWDIETTTDDLPEFWGWEIEGGAEVVLVFDGSEPQTLLWSESTIFGRLSITVGNEDSDRPAVILNHCRLVPKATLRLRLPDVTPEFRRGVVRFEDMNLRGGSIDRDQRIEIQWGESNTIWSPVNIANLGTIPSHVHRIPKYEPSENEL